MESASHLLLTGGTGFFGKALLQCWMENEFYARPTELVTVLSRDPNAFIALNPKFAALNWLRWHQGDIVNPESFPKHTRFTHIIHAAADSTLGPQLTLLQRYDQIFEGTRNVLNFAVRCELRRFLFISSGGVYGSQPPYMERVPEDWMGMPDPLNPFQAYGVAKRGAEHLCALYRHAYGVKTVIARCFAFVGPDLPLDVHFAIGNFIRDALSNEHITVSGDGSPLRSYMDQRDLAVWLDALLRKGCDGHAYNVGSDQAISIADLAYLVRDTVAPSKQVHILGTAGEQMHRNIYVPDITKASIELGLRVTIPLHDAIMNAAKRS